MPSIIVSMEIVEATAFATLLCCQQKKKKQKNPRKSLLNKLLMSVWFQMKLNFKIKFYLFFFCLVFLFF